MLKNIYNQTITILNKLKRTDSLTNVDVWYKQVINDAAWYTNSERDVTNNGVYIGTYTTVLIPFHNNCLEYSDWKKPGNQIGNYTISTGDYVILGIVTEDVNANNVIEVVKRYGENVCVVKHHRRLDIRFGAKVQLRIEGV